MWRTAITELLVYSLILFVAVADEDVSMSETTDLRIVDEGLGVFVFMAKHMTREITDLGFVCDHPQDGV